MAVRFATATGNWSNTAIWDNGALPTSADNVYPNGFTVTIDQDINVDGLNNNISPVYLPAMPIPKMTGNIVPSGIVNAGSDTSNAWKGFDQDAPTPTTFWAGTGVGSGTAWLSYQFTSTKIIKRYYIYRKSENAKPITWTFEGSNNGSTWDILETVTANALTTPYLSGVLANTTAYLYYRINITAVTSGTIANIYQFEMTESTATTYGAGSGGSFTVPASLSGTRNIVQTGDGIKSNNAATVMTLAHTTGNTVNFNISSGGYIINPLYLTTDASIIAIQINGNGTVNFNSDIWGCNQPSCRNINGSLNINANATVTINGNVYATKGAGSTLSTSIRLTSLSNSAILNINGSLIPSNLIQTSYALYSSSLANITITGNINSDISGCIYTDSNGSINITGTVQVNNNSGVPAIYSYASTSTGLLSGLVTINGSIINKNNISAIQAPRIRFTSNTNPYWTFQDSAAADITLSYGTPVTGPYPLEADVRYNTAYGASPTRYGTLRVPLPQYVSQGVLTDNTVGTAYLNAADVWNILTSTITVSGSIGERLKTASTVQTNGDQLAAYIV